MVTVFLDSRVIFAACGSETGASHAVIRLAEMGLFNTQITPYVIAEVKRNLEKRLPHEFSVLKRYIDNSTLIVTPTPSLKESQIWEYVIERKDTPIVAAAVAGKADYLLSLNTKDFTPTVARACGISIMTPGQFIQLSRRILNIGLKQN